MLRPARRAEDDHIKQMVRRAWLNPFGLEWQRFTVATNGQDAIVGCVQLKPHSDGSLELASLVVRPSWRKRGVGSALVAAVKEQSDGLLWLMCRQKLAPYYVRFGFESVLNASQMSPEFRRIWRLARLFGELARGSNGLAIMRWQADA